MIAGGNEAASAQTISYSSLEIEMILILFAIFAAIIASVLLMRFAGDSYGVAGTFAGVAGALLCCGAGLAAVVYAIAGWGWIGSEYKANIINREYKTNYTKEEIFYASSVIETIRELDRKRIELNGDLMKPSDE